MTRTPPPVARAWQPDAALLDGLTIAAVALAPDGTVVYANPAALDLFGSPFDDLVGSDARTRLFDEPERGVVDQVVRLLGKTGSWTGELAMLSGGSRVEAMHTSWTSLTDEGDRYGALILIEGASRGSLGEPVHPDKLSGSRLRRLASVTSELLSAVDVESVSAIVTDHMMNAAGATSASLSLLVDDVTHADQVQVARRHADHEVLLCDDPEDQVELVFALDGPGLDVLDHGSAVVWVDNRFADGESHMCLTPS